MNRLKTIAFIAVEAVLYTVFVYLDITGGSADASSSVKFASILICAAVAVGEAVKAVTGAGEVPEAVPGNREMPKSADREKIRYTGPVLLGAALLCTVFADRFLLFESSILPGIISFCLVQTIYLFVITGANLRQFLTFFGIRLACSAAGAVFLSGLAGGDRLLTAVVCFYGISFVGNIVHIVVSIVRSHTGAIKPPCLFAKPGLFATGLILFLLCDINVLIYNLNGYAGAGAGVPVWLVNAASILMWVFYLPSQIMIVLSGSGMQGINRADGFTRARLRK